MSYHIILNSWSGSETEKAESRLEKIFKLNAGKGGSVMDEIAAGRAWKFPHQISDKQAVTAAGFLESLGFEVILNPLSPTETGRSVPQESAAPESTANQQETANQEAGFNPFAEMTSPPFEETDYDPMAAPGESKAPFTTDREEAQQPVLGGDQSPVEGQSSVTMPSKTSEESEMPATAETGESYSAAITKRMAFHGAGGELFGIFINNILMNIVTLGIYHFWGKTKVRQYLWSQTAFAGDRFAYHGTGKELFLGWLKFIGILLVLGLLLTLLEALGPIGQLISVLLTIGFFLVIPLFMVGAWRYRLARSSWRGVQFSFRGVGKSAVWLYAKGAFLTMITLGFYTPFFIAQTEKFWRENSYMGDAHFEFGGNGKDVFKMWIVAILLMIPTAGIYFFWYQAKMKSYLWAHTHFGGGAFRFTATGVDFFKLNLGNLLLLIVTVGFGYAWVIVRNQNFLAEHLSLEGDAKLEQVLQAAEKGKVGGVGEVAVDGFDIPIGIG